MGAGIGAVIPMQFRVEKSKYKEENYPQRFIKHYDKTEREDKDYFIFKIQEDFLLNNHKDFLIKFYKLIGEDYLEYTASWRYVDGKERKKYGASIEQNAEKITDMKSFYDTYDKDKRSGYSPYVSLSRGIVSCNDCSPIVSWIFYFGTYKAFFEDYVTFRHLNNLIANTLDNPLAEVCHFAEIG